MVPPPRIELGTDAYKATVIPVNYKGKLAPNHNHRLSIDTVTTSTMIANIGSGSRARTDKPFGV